MKRILRFVCFADVLILIVLAACAPSAMTPSMTVATARLMTAISASPDFLETQAGLTRQLNITATYSDGSNRLVTAECSFSSDDNNIATVAVGGLVKGIGKGSTTISVMCSEAGITQMTSVLVNIFEVVLPPPTGFNFPGNIEQ